MKQLEEKVFIWAKERGIFDNATPIKQLEKTKEEVDELNEALIAQNNNLTTYINSKGKTVNTSEEIIDGIGDIFVTLLIQCRFQKIDILECLESAYNEISNRTGKMVNGKFVKD